MKSEIKNIADKQQAFRDDVAGIKERQCKLLVYSAIAAIIGGTLVSVGTKIVANRLFPAATAARAQAAPATAALPAPAASIRPAPLSPNQALARTHP